MTDAPNGPATPPPDPGEPGHPAGATPPPGPSEGSRAEEPTGPSLQGPSGALERMGAALPPRPARRTGVFVDPDELRDHVGDLLRAVLGGYEVDAFGNFTFTHEGARIFVTVTGSPIGPQVGVFCVTNLELDLTPELGTFLLTTNHNLGFGSFSYDPDNRAVWLRHSLLGTALDLPELRTAVAAVATTSATLDDAIATRFGGRTFEDAPDEVQRRMEPPEPSQETPAPGASGYL